MAEKKKKIANVPNLRFPEFEGEWKEEVLGELGDFIGGGTPSTANADFWNGDIPWISSSDLNDNDNHSISIKRFITEEAINNSATKICLAPVILIVSRVGVGKVAYSTEDICTSQDFTNIINCKCNGLFLSYLLLIVMRKAATSTQGTSIKGISSSEIKSKKIFIPKGIEQKKIAAFLSVIDNRISTQNKIIEELKLLKRTLSKKIFSQQVRFNGRSNFPNWEIKKLGEVAEIKRGASPRPITSPKWFSSKSNIGWVRISDVTKSNKYLEKTEQYLSDEGVLKSRLVAKNNLIMSICATIGKPIYTKFDVCIHDGFVVFQNLKINKEYLYYYLDLIQYNWYKYGQPGTQVNLNSEIVSNEICLFLP